MASSINALEQKLNEVFAEKAPKLHEGGKKFIVQWAPILSLVLGVLSLISALSLWRWAHTADRLVDYANTLCRTYATTPNCGTTSVSRISFWLWLSLAVVAVEGILYLLAYPGLRDRKKQGWNYLYYGALINIAFAVLGLFASYGGFGNFIGSLIGSAIGFYFLFQIRSHYLGAAEPKRVAPAAPDEPKVIEHKPTAPKE